MDRITVRIDIKFQWGTVVKAWFVDPGRTLIWTVTEIHLCNSPVDSSLGSANYMYLYRTHM